jgi:hypothetical protein
MSARALAFRLNRLSRAGFAGLQRPAGHEVEGNGLLVGSAGARQDDGEGQRAIGVGR